MRFATSAAHLLVAIHVSLLWSCHPTHGPLGTARESRCAVEPDPLLYPAPRDAYASTPEQVVAPLRHAIDAAVCQPDGANGTVLLDTAAALDAKLKTGRDVMPLGRVRVLLEDAPEPDDPRFREVLRAFRSIQRSYHFNDVTPGRPTLFLIHGSDRGPFNTFAPYFEAFAQDHDVIFVLYDSFQSTSQKADWLAGQIRDWRAAAQAGGALHIIAWSDGTTVLRKARLDDHEGLFRNARIVNLAPPLAGSYRARWVDDGPMRIVAFPALLYLDRNSYLMEMAQDYNPYGDFMAAMYDRRTNEILAENLGAGSELNVVAEGDPHAPHRPLFGFLEPEFDEYSARYEASLGRNYVRIPVRTENPHQDITRDPDAIRAVVRHFSAEPASGGEPRSSEERISSGRHDARIDPRNGRA